MNQYLPIFSEVLTLLQYRKSSKDADSLAAPIAPYVPETEVIREPIVAIMEPVTCPMLEPVTKECANCPLQYNLPDIWLPVFWKDKAK